MKEIFGKHIKRRQFLAGAGTAALVTGFPAVLRAQEPEPIKIGLVHPVTGFVSFSGTQSRAGAELAIADINAAGGIKSLGGAKLQAILGDSQGRPELGASETARVIEEGACAVVAGYSSAVTLATSQEAAKTNTPHVVDVGVADNIMDRGLKNTFRFAPGYGSVAATAIEALREINAGGQAKTAVIIHEESLFGTGTAELLAAELPKIGIEVLQVIKHANPTRDFTNIALQLRSLKPDIIIPANYYNEYVLLARTLRQQRIEAKAIYSVLGGAASNVQFVKEFPEAAEYIMDCNHWYDPKSELALKRRAEAEAKGLYYTYEVFLTYNAVAFLADAIERAGSTDKEAIIEALRTSTFSDHGMPYGPTQIDENGQNLGARAVNTQVLNGNIEVVLPKEFASAEVVFPMPSRS
ncbi:ABC transporter substrate-binding protein [Chelativorans composti]|jgi:branched-chain amino acid transport system substrate-binding protein|uniref:ABC transporter substrate-binding protein n=1 Tax=Chelativorans composti TaxID=768533 RepID=A0ABW5DCU6_9HYPH